MAALSYAVRCVYVCVCVYVGAAFCAGHNWFANTLIALFFPAMKSGLGDYTFLPFAGTQ